MITISPQVATATADDELPTSGESIQALVGGLKAAPALTDDVVAALAARLQVREQKGVLQVTGHTSSEGQ